jgi:hypothetical protein
MELDKKPKEKGPIKKIINGLFCEPNSKRSYSVEQQGSVHNS